MSVRINNRRKGAAPDAPPLAERDADDAGGELELGARARRLSAILDSLRNEEDSYHFEIANSAGGGRRVVIDDAGLLIGWDETGRRVGFDAASVRAPRARVRKSWSGVLVRPHSPGTVEVNGEPVEEERRLRDGDRLTLLPTVVDADPHENFLVFHETALLVALDSLLPRQSPPTDAPEKNVTAVEVNQRLHVPRSLKKMPKAGSGCVSPRQSYSGYFTLGEVVILFTGAFVATVVVFMSTTFL